MKTRIRRFILLMLSFWLTAGEPNPSRAANLIWDANPTVFGPSDGSGNWDTGLGNTNWWNGVLLANQVWSNTVPDSAIFGINSNGAAGIITLLTNIRSSSLTFNPAASGNYTLAGNGFFLTNTTTMTVNDSVTLNVPLIHAVATGSPLWTVAPGKTLTINSNVVGTGVAANTLTCNGPGTWNFASISGIGGVTIFQGGGIYNLNGGTLVAPSATQVWFGFCTNGQVNTVNYNAGNMSGQTIFMGRQDVTQNGTNYFNLQSGSVTTSGLDLIGQVNGVSYFTISGGAFTNNNAAASGTAFGNWSASGFGSNLTTVLTINGTGRAVFNGPTAATILLPRTGQTGLGSVQNTLGVYASNSIVTSVINLDGGTLMTSRQIFKNGAGLANSIFNFNGGLFQASTNSQPNWISLLNHAYVKTGGAIIDVRNLSMGIPQALEHDPAGPAVDGGLVKLGAGILTLGGANTYNGPTLVTNGTLVVSGSSSGGTTITVSHGASLNVGGTVSGGGSVTVFDSSALTVGGSVSDPVTINSGGNVSGTGFLGSGAVNDAGSITPGAGGAGTLSFTSLALGSTAADRTTNNINVFSGAKISGGTVVLKGTNVINITGPAPTSLGAYDLINYSSITTNGIGRFVLGSLPYGTGGYLNDSGSAIQYVATNYTSQGLVWIGKAASTWNLTNSLDWFGDSSLASEAYHDFLTTTFNDSATNYIVTLSGSLAPLNITVTAASNYLFRGTGGIVGPTPLTVNGPGSLTVGTSNSYSGGTLVSGGTLLLTNGGFVSGDIIDDSVLAFDRSDSSMLNGTISGSGSLIKRGTGVVTLNGTNTYSGGTTVNNGALALTVNSAANGGFGSIINTLTVTTNATVLSQANDSFGTVGGASVNPLNLIGGTLVHTPGNNLSLWGTTINLTGGNLSATNIGGRLDLGNGATVNTFSNAITSVIGGSSLSLRQSINTFTIERGNSPLDLLVTAPISQSVTASITKQGAGVMVLGANNTYLDGTSINEGTLQVGNGGGTGTLGTGPVNNSGTLVFNRTNSYAVANDIGGSGGIVQAGSGVTTLSGVNSYNGPTTVSNGTLQINSSLSGGGSMQVRPNSTFLHAAGANGSFSTFTVNAGATVGYVAGSTTDAAATTDGLTLNGPATVQILNPLPTVVGVYDLINYNGAIGGSGLGALSLSLPTPRVVGSLITNLAGTAVQLNLISLGQLQWNGNVTGTWDVSGANEWKLVSTNITATGFTNGDVVVFNDTNTTYTVNVATNVAPGSVTITAATNYLFTGLGSISGGASLVQNGPGTLVVANTNTYSGGTTINGGTLQVTNKGVLPGNITIASGMLELADGGSLTGNLTDNSTLAFNRSDVLTFARPIAGSGTVLNKGPGIVTLSGTDTYSGGTIVRAGTLQFAAAGSLGTGDVTLTDADTGANAASALGVTVNTGAGGRYTIANNFIVASNSTAPVIIGVTNAAALVVNSGIFFGGNVTLNKDTTLLAQNGEVYINSSIFGNGNLTCAGNARVLLNSLGAGGFTGNVYVTNTAAVQILQNRLGADRHIDLAPGSAIIVQDSAQIGMLTGSGNAAEIVAHVGTLTVGNGDGSWTFNGSFVGGTFAGQTLVGTGFGLIKAGTGTFTFNGIGDYTANTEIAAGTMLVNGSLSTASAVIVDAGASLGGTGIIGGAVTNNGSIAPGASIGTLTTGTETWNPNSTYSFEITNATAVGGSDRLNINGTLDIQANAGNPTTVKLISLNAANAPGPMSGFTKAGSYTWTLAATTGGILNFDPASFVLDTSGIANDFSGGAFNIGTNGNSLVVNFVGTAPAVTGFGKTGGNFYVLFTGPSGQTYSVLTSTNITTPMTNWLTLLSGTFSGSAVGFTNAGVSDPQRFFRVVSP